MSSQVPVIRAVGRLCLLQWALWVSCAVWSGLSMLFVKLPDSVLPSDLPGSRWLLECICKTIRFKWLSSSDRSCPFLQRRLYTYYRHL